MSQTFVEHMPEIMKHVQFFNYTKVVAFLLISHATWKILRKNLVKKLVTLGYSFKYSSQLSYYANILDWNLLLKGNYLKISFVIESAIKIVYLNANKQKEFFEDN